MSQQEANLLWLRDLLEHLATSQKQLEWAERPQAVGLICETMIRDLERCKRLCEAIRQRALLRSPA
jgi:hypothetical protein